MKKTVFVILTAFIMFTAPAEILYEVIDLGSIPGYDVSIAWGINNHGQVIGYAMEMSSWTATAVLFDTSGSGANTDIGTASDVDSYAYGINESGQIVGQSRSGETEEPYTTVFDPTGSGDNTYLYQSSSALSINNNGIAAGLVIDQLTGMETAALFDVSQPGFCTELGVLDGYDASYAYSINDTGTIVGNSHRGSFPREYRATLFDSTGKGANADLGTLGGQSSAALYINKHGQIVGTADTSSGKRNAAIFDPTDHSNNLDLGGVEGFLNSVAVCINNNGEIVGQAHNLYDDPCACAVLFDSSGNGSNIKLNDVIDPTLGWQLYLATGINDHGWICGSGMNASGETHAFLLKPVPEPMILILMCSGFIAIRKRQQ